MAKLFAHVVLVFLTLVLVHAWAHGQTTVIWYLPHPDDETIGMADSIHQSVLEGNRNYFVYFSKGENSLVRHHLKGPDGQVYRLTKEEFGEARVRETLAALEVLGVKAHQVLFLDFADGAIPLEAAQETMRLFATLYPGSIHRTVSRFDLHEDHQTLARALVSVSAEMGGSIYPQYFQVYSYGNPQHQKDSVHRKVMYPEIKAEALAQLSCFDPDQGRFAISATSTPGLVKGALASEYEYLDPTDQNTSQTKPPLNVGITLSNLDLGLCVPLGENLNMAGLYDFKASTGLVELNLQLADDLPFLRFYLGLGYHLAYKKPYVSTGASLGSGFVKIRHVPQEETRFGVGITTFLQQR